MRDNTGTKFDTSLNIINETYLLIIGYIELLLVGTALPIDSVILNIK